MHSGCIWLLGLLVCGSVSRSATVDFFPNLVEILEWKNIEYDYPSVAARQAAIDSGEFIPANCAPIDFDAYKLGDPGKQKNFVTVPRFVDGIPATLGLVTSRTYEGNPILAPYPSWAWHQNFENCSAERIVSVFRVKIDECNRLWVLDSGSVVDDLICPPQILAFDLATDELVVQYEIPSDQIQSTSILVTPIVDIRDSKCDNAFVYAADCQGFGLIVYDVKKGTSWRIQNKSMYPDPAFGTYHILGQHFDLMDGILGMDLSPYKPGQDRVLYYHAMSSNTENWVYTSVIRNESLFATDPGSTPGEFHTYWGRRSSQVPAEAIDSRGIAYFGLASDLTVNCWDTKTSYNSLNIKTLVRNKQTLQFLSGVKVIRDASSQEFLLILSNRFQKVATDTLDLAETNFRVQRMSTDSVVGLAVCVSIFR